MGTSYLQGWFYSNEGTVSKRLYSDAGDSCLFPPSFASRTAITPKYVVSCQSGGSCFSLSAQGPPLFSRCVISCPLAPAPISLLIPSYLPALTVMAQTLTLDGLGLSPSLSIISPGKGLWTSYSLSPNLLICTMGIIIKPTSQDWCENWLRWVWQAPSTVLGITKDSGTAVLVTAMCQALCHRVQVAGRLGSGNIKKVSDIPTWCLNETRERICLISLPCWLGFLLLALSQWKEAVSKAISDIFSTRGSQ